MPVGGQGNAGPEAVSHRPSNRFDDGGFTMVVLLVVMAIMAIGMTAMLPAWRHQAVREKEEELIFRANQYARAIVLYSRKNNNLLPASVDALYDGKFLRKKWKDPITGNDFALLPAGQPFNTAPGGSQGRGGRGGSSSFGGQQTVGSFQGVYSTSTETSIRVYQNLQRYSDWQFTLQTALARMGGAQGGPGGGAGRPGGTAGQPGQGPGGRGGQGSPIGSPGVGQPGRGGLGGGSPAPPTRPGGRGGRGGT
jgi:type II secretory pathway pseudopilin PulG